MFTVGHGRGLDPFSPFESYQGQASKKAQMSSSNVECPLLHKGDWRSFLVVPWDSRRQKRKKVRLLRSSHLRRRYLRGSFRVGNPLHPSPFCVFGGLFFFTTKNPQGHTSEDIYLPGKRSGTKMFGF